jgi:hypothetical protein
MPIFKLLRTSSLIIILCFSTNFCFSQSNKISIKFIGNCGLYITDGTTNIYTDFPYKSGAHSYMEFDSAELDSIQPNSIFIFTHKHSDHYSKKHLKKVLKTKKGQAFGPWNITELEQLKTIIPEFNIETFKTQHKVFGISFKHYSYLITWHEKRIFLSGDTESANTIGNLKNLDWVFVPYWLLIDAEEHNISIDTEQYGIYHLYPEQIPSAKKKWDDTSNIHPLVKQGNIIQIDY